VKALWQFLGLSDRNGDEGAGRDGGAPARATVIGAGISIKGELRGEGGLAMFGQFEGEVVVNGAVHVGPEARVDANITASEITIAGAVRGNLSVAGRVEILGRGSLTGTLKSESLSAGSGATVKGEVWVEPARVADHAIIGPVVAAQPPASLPR
jgi:cytoskeletal protein CcmA (bactofilin family)